MSDPHVTRLADLLVNYCVSIAPGDWVLVHGHVLALPLVEEVVKHVARAGGHPTVSLASEQIDAALMAEAASETLAWTSPLEQLLANGLDARISIRAAHNTRAFGGIDPQRQRTYEAARQKYGAVYRRRTAAGTHRWVGTLFPCPAFAQEADMSLHQFEDFVYAATYADQPNPVQRWQAVHDEQQRLIDWLTGKEQVAVRGPHVDLSLSIAGRTFINSDGKRNMPSGEIFTGPVEDSVNGWVEFTYPAIRQGREVTGVRLEFEQGKVVRATADKNAAYLLSQLDTDAGARYLGEFAIGTNYQIQRFTKQILYDEKIGGTIHMAVGAGYPESGSINESSLHWDFICDMHQESEIRVDGELFYKDGRFVV